ncbi:methylated-DNA--[protein]-cysteine S-methyltransferase [Peptoniphilus grossensis]|uniref:methylated-DNA--[protein]-cysteine S-methyltransferase n=1 Tax=Peptoniphilus grossensis TaxID=1465756 RepID=UPI0002F050FF|nr:methylated-DNA--[protein]-cysteine S-methyltransferase [Peptoniphilus grossensis]
MLYRSIYSSPLGKILILFHEGTLLGLYFEGQEEFNVLIKNEEVKNFDDGKDSDIKDKNLSGKSLGHEKNKVSGEKICDDKILGETKKWLDLYFSGEEPNFTPKLKLEGTEFRREVWKILLKIPYGETLTYKDIAEKLVASGKYERMSAQAVGGAVGHNPFSIIIPCHRVVGTSGSLTAYAGGLARKVRLLELEGVDVNKFFMPKNHK